MFRIEQALLLLESRSIHETGIAAETGHALAKFVPPAATFTKM